MEPNGNSSECLLLLSVIRGVASDRGAGEFQGRTGVDEEYGSVLEGYLAHVS